jgi:hypothetical protein
VAITATEKNKPRQLHSDKRGTPVLQLARRYRIRVHDEEHKKACRRDQLLPGAYWLQVPPASRLVFRFLIWTNGLHNACRSADTLG